MPQQPMIHHCNISEVVNRKRFLQTLCRLFEQKRRLNNQYERFINVRFFFLIFCRHLQMNHRLLAWENKVKITLRVWTATSLLWCIAPFIIGKHGIWTILHIALKLILIDWLIFGISQRKNMLSPPNKNRLEKWSHQNQWHNWQVSLQLIYFFPF